MTVNCAGVSSGLQRARDSLSRRCDSAIRLRASWCLFALVLSVADPLVAQESTTGPAVPSIEEVRAKVDETLGSILTLRVRYRRSQSIDPESPVDLRGVDSIDWHDHVWTWWMDGEKRAVECEPMPLPESALRIHETSDGQKTYIADYKVDNPEVMTALAINSPAGRARFYNFYPDSWLGLRLDRTDHTLRSLLARQEAMVIGWEELDKHDCLRVNLGECQSHSGTSIWFEVWLDPEHDWLPRQMVSRNSVRGTTGKAAEHVYRHVITDFRQILDPVLNRMRWFPSKRHVRELARIDFDVLEVAVNEQLPKSLFVIEPQRGTEIQEWLPNNPEQPAQWRIHGGQHAVAGVRQQTVEAGRAMWATAESNSVDASPRPTLSMTMYSWIVAILLVGAAVFAWLRQR